MAPADLLTANLNFQTSMIETATKVRQLNRPIGWAVLELLNELVFE